MQASPKQKTSTSSTAPPATASSVSAPAALSPTSLSQTAVSLQSELGATTIEPHVVAKIAGLAIREVPGVHALVPFGTGQAITNLARQLSGDEFRDLGVRVDVGKIEAAVDARIVTDYGLSIPDIAAAVRINVGERIRGMTGLKVKEVNLEIVDLYFEGGGRPEGSPARVQ